jgi:hypothetical protein
MPPAGFEPAVPVSERPQTHALDRAATAIRPLRVATLYSGQTSAGFIAHAITSDVLYISAYQFVCHKFAFDVAYVSVLQAVNS